MRNEDKKIEEIRRHIDQVDLKILELLRLRFDAVREIGVLKTQNRSPIEDIDRELFIQKQLREYAKIHEMDLLFLERVWQEILSESYRIQKGVSADA